MELPKSGAGRVLLYRRGGLGDTLLTYPVLEVLKKLGYRTTVVGNTDYFKLAKYLGWVEEVLPEFIQGKWDIEIIFSFEGGIEPFPKERIWIVDYYFKELKLPKIYSRRIDLRGGRGLLRGKAVIHPSSGSRKKNPPLELFFRIKKFLEEEGLKTTFILGEADLHLGDLVKDFFYEGDLVKLSLELKDARVFVGNDSGLSHLASYLGVKSFLFYGPTDPVVWKPLGEATLISLNLPCSPCFPKVCEGRPCLDQEKLFKLFVSYYNISLC